MRPLERISPVEDGCLSWLDTAITLGSISAALSGPAFVPGKERRLTFPSQRLVTEPTIIPAELLPT